MTGLSLGGKEQNGLLILVLDTRQRAAVQRRHIVGQLPLRMGIEPVADPGDQLAEGMRRSLLVQRRFDGFVLRRAKHALLRENQLKNGVVRQTIPVDQLTQHVAIGAEGQNPGHHPNRLPGRLRDPPPFRLTGDIPPRNRLITLCAVAIHLLRASAHQGRANDAVSIGRAANHQQNLEG